MKAQFPFSESFKNSTATGMQFDGTPTAFLTGGAGQRYGYNDPDGSGYLRLTNNQMNQRGIVWWDDYSFPSAYGMTISFEYYTHGGTGADGIAFILFDATASSVTPGAFGGSLGYAQTTSINGFSKGYLGIGIDEYGNFMSNMEGKNGGVGNWPSNITLRGQGSGTSGYPYLIGVQTTNSPYLFNVAGGDRTATDNSKPGFRKIEIILKPNAGNGFFIDVNLTHGNIKSTIISNYQYTTPAPPKLKLAISSSTGGDTNFHEIRNLNITVDQSTLLMPVARPNLISGCAGMTATTTDDININNNGAVNALGTINRTSVDLDLDIPGIQSSKTVSGKGTFTYDSNTGKITFTPLNNSVEESVSIDYTFNDSYGKTSNISTITYNPIINRPQDIITQKIITLGENYTWPVNGQNYSATGIYTKKNDGCSANQVLELTVNPPLSACSGEMQVILKDDFGAGVSDRGPEPLDFTSTYNYTASGGIGNNGYSVMKNAKQGNNAWSSGGDHTTGKNGNGYMLIFDANTTLGSVFYEKKYSGLCSGSLCTFSIYAANLVPSSYGGFTVKPMVKIDLINPVTGVILKSMLSSELQLSKDDELLWKELSLSFNIPAGLDTIIVRVSNGQADTNGNGNDVAFDDVSFSICVPPVTISLSDEKICEGTSAVLLATLNNPTSITYAYQWQNFDGTNWVDIIGATSNQYTTPPLFDDTKYRVRYAQEGIDIDNNNNLNCSGSKETTIQVIQQAKADDIIVEPIYDICEGSETTITPSSNAGTNFYWYDGPTSEAILLSSSSSYSTGILDNSKTYYIAVSGDDYCENKPEDRKVVIANLILKPTPVTTIIDICFETSYLWSVNEENYNASGTYVKINDGCTANEILNLTVGTELTTSFTQTNVKCKGNSDGSVVITPSGGKEPYNIPPTTGLNAGMHTFTITDANGCTTDVEVNITEPEQLTAVSANQVNVSCNGLSDGSVEITASGGTEPYSITPTTGLNAGTHTFTITDTNGCTTEVEVNITEPEVLSTVFTQTNVSCNGLSDGSVEITASGGTKPYSIPPTTGLNAGTHTFTITDANGCTTDVDVIITEPEVLSAVFTQINVSCNGLSDGSVEITASGGTEPYSITPTTGLNAGTHTFTITDTNGCTTKVEVNITAPEVLSAVFTQTNVSCNGLSDGSVEITASGGTEPYNIPPTTELNAGTHIFTITDTNGCTTEVEVNITEPETLSAVFTQTNVSCNGLSDGSAVITASGGTEPYSIPQTTGLNAGRHIFTITDFNGCTTEVEVNITEPETLSAVFTQTNVSCSGLSDGSVQVTALGGTAPYDIPSTTGLKAGTHIFTITDTNGCTTDIEVNITEPALLSAVFTQINVSCNGLSDGSVKINASGGTAPYNIPPTTGLNAGTHTFTITDANDCTTDIEVIITEPEILSTVFTQTNVSCNGLSDGSVEITASGGTAPYSIPPTTGLNAGRHIFTITDTNGCTTDLEVNITEPETLSAVFTQTNVSCNGLSDGSVVITALGGTAPYSIPSTTGLNAGKHTFTITDTNGCTTNVEVNITQPAVLTAISTKQVDVKCKGEATGSVLITPSGGTGPYTITPPQTGLTAGAYIFNVIDSQKCSTEVRVTITEPAMALNAVIQSQADVKCKGGADGSVLITPIGGTAPYDITPSQIGLAAGVHTFTLTDYNNCKTTIKATIAEPAMDLAATLKSQVNVKCKGDASGSVLIMASGGIAPYTITPEQTGLPAGVHTFTVTDYNNCKTTLKATITEPAMALSATIKTQFNVECKGEASGSVLIIPSGGTGPYVITPPQTGLMAGDYTFTVTDGNKCTTPVKVTITEPLLLQAKVLEPLLPEFCQGDKDGAFSIEISGGTIPYTYSLDSKKGPFLKAGPQQNIIDLTGLSAGSHIVYITDASGCTAQVSAILPDAVKLNPMVEISTECVQNATANRVRVIVDPSIDNPADVDYSLDGGTYQSGNVFTNLAPGKHTITARHSNGCTRTAKEFTIQYIAPLELSIEDGELNQILATPNGGQGPYRYSFEGEPYTTENKFTIYKSGVYQVGITDKNGCSATVSRYFEYIDLCIPNHFTPNGDGINDQWGPGCSTSYKNLTFAIFDRHGRIIGNFKYGQKWDGKYNGNELSSGDYWYVFKLNDNKDNREFVGHFTLYR